MPSLSGGGHARGPVHGPARGRTARARRGGRTRGWLRPLAPRPARPRLAPGCNSGLIAVKG